MSDKPAKTDSKTVADYLLENPDFYQSHPEVLENLELSHGVNGSASLLEKQIVLLRDKNQEISDKLFQLIEIARAHENLSLALHKIAAELIKQFAAETISQPRAARIQRIGFVCKDILQASLVDVHVVIHWFSNFIGDAGTGISIIDAQDQRISGLIERLYADNKPICGPFSKPERIVLFPKLLVQPQSAVIAPLQQSDNGKRIGLLMLLSHDPNRYVAGKGTMFLVQLMRLIECALTSREVNDENNAV